jgi:hypothetical protein
MTCLGQTRGAARSCPKYFSDWANFVGKKINETMPTKKPTMSWEAIRTLTEKFTWRDPRTGIVTRGYNPPGGKDGKGVKRVPFHIRYITGKGCVEEGFCICLKVYPDLRQRMVQFVESKQIRRVRDYLIMEIDGIRIVTH